MIESWSFVFVILAKLISFDLTNLLWKKLQNRKNQVLTKSTFYSIPPVVINLQTWTISHFKGHFIINDSFVYHGWVPVASGAVSLLTFETPGSETPSSLISFLIVQNLANSAHPILYLLFAHPLSRDYKISKVNYHILISSKNEQNLFLNLP